uniref:Uncharacterized protein n=1 Tax=Arundo donax TaxID=35708 RepID=A0A0A9GU91_ARUDO
MLGPGHNDRASCQPIWHGLCGHLYSVPTLALFLLWIFGKRNERK